MRGVEPGICTICPPFHKYCGQEVDILPRTTKCRRVCIAPDNRVFTPKRPCGKPVTLRLEELESLRLCDLEGLEQDSAAQRMEVSRGTFQRILYRARQKVAGALCEGCPIVIEGGKYQLASSGQGCPHSCSRCYPNELQIGKELKSNE